MEEIRKNAFTYIDMLLELLGQYSEGKIVDKNAKLSEKIQVIEMHLDGIIQDFSKSNKILENLNDLHYLIINLAKRFKEHLFTFKIFEEENIDPKKLEIYVSHFKDIQKNAEDIVKKAHQEAVQIQTPEGQESLINLSKSIENGAKIIIERSKRVESLINFMRLSLDMLEKNK